MAVYCTLTHRLGDAYDNFLKTAPTNSYAVMDEQGWHLIRRFRNRLWWRKNS